MRHMMWFMAVSPSVLAPRSEQVRDIFPRVATQAGKGTHDIVKRPDQAGLRVPTRGPSHLHPTRGTNLNPATTRSYAEVVRGVTPRSELPTMATGPPHNTRHRDWGGRRFLCAPIGEKTPQVDILGPKSRSWGEVPHRRLGMAAWTHLANDEGSCLPMCRLDTEK